MEVDSEGARRPRRLCRGLRRVYEGSYTNYGRFQVQRSRNNDPSAALGFPIVVSILPPQNPVQTMKGPYIMTAIMTRLIGVIVGSAVVVITYCDVFEAWQ